MKPAVVVIAVVSFFLSGGVTFAIVRWLGKGSPELAFVVGAIVGTELAAVVHHRNPGATNSAGVKALIGAALAMSTVVLATLLHLVVAPFEYPQISIPIAVVGTFVFPFVLFDTMWKALSGRAGR